MRRRGTWPSLGVNSRLKQVAHLQLGLILRRQLEHSARRSGIAPVRLPPPLKAVPERLGSRRLALPRGIEPLFQP